MVRLVIMTVSEYVPAPNEFALALMLARTKMLEFGASVPVCGEMVNQLAIFPAFQSNGMPPVLTKL